MNLYLNGGIACPTLAIVSSGSTPALGLRANLAFKVDWSLYGKFVEGTMNFLNTIATASLELLGSVATEPFPPFFAKDAIDSESVSSFSTCYQPKLTVVISAQLTTLSRHGYNQV